MKKVVMPQLTQNERCDLAARRICSIADDPRRQVLVPIQLSPHFDKLHDHGGRLRSIDVREEIYELAHEQLGGRFFNRATPEQAPRLFSCSTFTKWIFAQVGIWLPRYAVDQSYSGRPIEHGIFTIGSLLFFRNTFSIHVNDRSVGHVAMLVDHGKMIHGSCRTKQIAHAPVPEFLLRARDPIPQDPHILIELPLNMHGVETALDVARWLQRM